MNVNLKKAGVPKGTPALFFFRLMLLQRIAGAFRSHSIQVKSNEADRCRD